MTTYHIRANHLQMSGGHEATFPYDINEVAASGEVLIVLLDVPTNESMTENVFGVSEAGDILWQIEKIPATATNPINSYSGIISVGDRTAKIFNWNGMGVEIDTQSGRVLSEWFSR